MYYLIGRDLDGDGKYEFIQDMNRMILTEDPHRAMQISASELDDLDMEYLNQAGFYALEADRFELSLLDALLFHPMMRGYRPPIAPPPRRRPPRRGFGILGALFASPPKPRRAPRPAPRRPAPAPRCGGHGGRPGPGGPGGREGRPGPGGHGGPGGRGGHGGPGGRPGPGGRGR